MSPSGAQKQPGWRTADVLRAAAVVFALYFVLQLIWLVHPVILTGFIGVLFGLAVSRGADLLERIRVPRGIAAGLIVLATYALLAGVLAIAAPTLQKQFGELRAKLPQATDRLDQWLAANKGSIWSQMLTSSPEGGEAGAAGGGEPAATPVAGAVAAGGKGSGSGSGSGLPAPGGKAAGAGSGSTRRAAGGAPAAGAGSAGLGAAAAGPGSAAQSVGSAGSGSAAAARSAGAAAQSAGSAGSSAGSAGSGAGSAGSGAAAAGSSAAGSGAAAAGAGPGGAAAGGRPGPGAPQVVSAPAPGAAAGRDGAEPSPLRRRLTRQLVAATRYLFPFLSSTFEVLAGLLLITFVAIYYGVDPAVYRRGVLHLVPHRSRARANEVVTAIGATLRRWLMTQLIAMVVIGSLVAITLWLLGIEAALSLGIIAGVLEFIPTIGPLLSAVPAIGMGFLVSPEKALAVAVAFTLVQMIEGHVLIPMLMKRGMNLPPLLTILGQAIMAVVFGFLGLLVAVPLVAMILTAVKMLYVNDVMGDEVATGTST